MLTSPHLPCGRNRRGYPSLIPTLITAILVFPLSRFLTCRAIPHQDEAPDLDTHSCLAHQSVLISTDGRPTSGSPRPRASSRTSTNRFAPACCAAQALEMRPRSAKLRINCRSSTFRGALPVLILRSISRPRSRSRLYRRIFASVHESAFDPKQPIAKGLGCNRWSHNVLALPQGGGR